jgi:hypothetical protein
MSVSNEEPTELDLPGIERGDDGAGHGRGGEAEVHAVDRSVCQERVELRVALDRAVWFYLKVNPPAKAVNLVRISDRGAFFL